MLKPSRLPILLSAFGFPGLGQFFQKRWIPAFLFSSSFLIGFFWVMKLALHNIIELYSMAFDPAAEPEPMPLSGFGVPLILVAVIYIISLIDVFQAQHRTSSKRREDDFLKAHETADT